MELLNLKAIPIAYERGVYFLDKKESEVINKTKYKKSEQGFYLSETISLLENKTFAPLKKFIIKKVKEYTRDVLGIKDQIYLTQSWSTINTTNAFHKPHEHPNTFISFIYYAQCKDGALRFDLNTTSIREGFNFDFTVNKFNVYNSQRWELPVNSGDIVLFPGHVRHSSVPNKSIEPRIIVGANFFIKGRLGSEKRLTNITI